MFEHVFGRTVWLWVCVHARASAKRHHNKRVTLFFHRIDTWLICRPQRIDGSVELAKKESWALGIRFASWQRCTFRRGKEDRHRATSLAKF